MNEEGSHYLHRMWEQGQEHLVRGRYVAARRELELAEAIAWRRRDPQTLARIYLPLLEARRQIRYHAVEGTLLIETPGIIAHEQRLSGFIDQPAGTVLLGCIAHGEKRPGRGGKGKRKPAAAASGEAAACRLAGSVQYAARRTGRWLEALLLIAHEGTGEVRLSSQADPTFAAGLPVRWVEPGEPAAPGDSTDPQFIVPLPPPGRYHGGKSERASQGASAAAGALAREALLIAWEALALKWQRRHPPPRTHATPGEAGWQEMAWLRLALRVDPACEPVTMRLIGLAESLARL